MGTWSREAWARELPVIRWLLAIFAILFWIPNYAVPILLAFGVYANVRKRRLQRERSA